MTELDRFNALYESLCIDGQLIHVGQLLPRAARMWPDNTIVICKGKSITYRELFLKVKRVTRSLISKGVKPRDHVIIYHENAVEFYIAYFAVWHAGAVVAPLNILLHENELIKIIENAHPAAIIVSDELKAKITAITAYTLPPIITDADMYASESVEPVEEPIARDVQTTAAILYTSGTTGFPKGVMLNSRNIIINTIQGISRLEVKEAERIFCGLPLFHTLPQNTCLWTNVVLGSTAILIPKVDRHAIVEALTHKPTVVVAVPALYGLFCKLKTLDFEQVRYFFAGGDALSDKIREYFELLYRRKLCNGYGLTETAPFISVDIDDYTQPTSTIGRPFIGVECAIRDDNGVDLPQGTIGILWVKGENIMQGYYQMPEATAQLIHDGWLNTGDLGYISDEGKIILAGREKDLIKRKGINVYPQEIENILLRHTDVIQAGVVSIHEQDDEIPVAFIATLNTNTDELTKELQTLCVQNLAVYKIPRKFYFKKELPLTTTGKIDKKLLRKELESL